MATLLQLALPKFFLYFKEEPLFWPLILSLNDQKTLTLPSKKVTHSSNSEYRHGYYLAPKVTEGCYVSKGVMLFPE